MTFKSTIFTVKTFPTFLLYSFQSLGSVLLCHLIYICIYFFKASFIFLNIGIWFYPDGNRVPMLSDSWSGWDDGQPAVENCSAMTNYQFWTTRMITLGYFLWRAVPCTVNPGKLIQGYICESE